MHLKSLKEITNMQNLAIARFKALNLPRKLRAIQFIELLDKEQDEHLDRLRDQNGELEQ